MHFDFVNFHKKIENSEIKTNLSSLIEKFAMPLALYGSLATLPQVYEVIALHRTEGVSILTFGMYLTGNVFWFSYGLLHKDKPIMASHLTTGVLNLIIVLGVLF